MPADIAPFAVAIIPMGYGRSEAVKAAAAVHDAGAPRRRRRSKPSAGQELVVRAFELLQARHDRTARQARDRRRPRPALVRVVGHAELHQRGVRIIAVSDRYGAIRNARGLNIPALSRHVAAGKPLKAFPGAEPMDAAELLTTPCTILVPAALERVIDQSNAGKLRCRILAEGANGPTTMEADAILAPSRSES